MNQTEPHGNQARRGQFGESSRSARGLTGRRSIAVAVSLACCAALTILWWFPRPDTNPVEDSDYAYPKHRAIESMLARIQQESRRGVEPQVMQPPPEIETAGEQRFFPIETEPAIPPKGYQFVTHQGRMKRAPSDIGRQSNLTANPTWLNHSVSRDKLELQARDAGRDWVLAAARLANPGTDFTELVRALSFLGGEYEGISGEFARVRVPADSGALESFSGLPHFLGFGAMPAELKIHRQFAQQASTRAPAELVPVFITLMADDPEGEWRAPLEDLGVTVGAYDPILRSYTASMPYGMLARLAETDFVMAIQPVAVASVAHDTAVPVMGVDVLRAYQPATSRFTGLTGRGIPVGLLDTGLNTRHVDISRDRNSICGVNTVYRGLSDLWADWHGHGTRVTGTLLGAGQDRPDLAGAAPGVGHIRFAKVLHSGGIGASNEILLGMGTLARPSSCIYAGEDSMSVLPLIVNMSLGTSGISFSGRGVEERKLDALVFGSNQLYVVAQANSGALAVSNFATAKNSLAVGAVDDGGIIAYFSSHGPTADGRLAPNLVGTGVDITSTVGRSRPSGYETRSGTSFASPYVAGVAALLMEAESDFREQPALARARLMASAIRPATFLEAEEHFPVNNSNGPGALQNQYGLGLASARASTLSRDTPSGWVLGSATSSPEEGSYEYVDIQVPQDASRLDIVMTWDEPPADTLTNSVINNLDLLVDEGADCTVEPCGEHVSRSQLDNVEWLFIKNPMRGIYRVKVVPKRLIGEQVKAAIAWTIIRGGTVPQLTIELDQTKITTAKSGEFEVVATVGSDEYLASGVTLHMNCRGEEGGSCDALRQGVRVAESRIIRKDGIGRSLHGESRFWDKAISMGEIAAGETRDVRLKVAPRWRSLGSSWHFTASAWNARSATTSVLVDILDEVPATTLSSASEGDPGDLSVNVPASPANDDFWNAAELEGLDGSQSLDLIAASREPGEPSVRSNSRTVWYNWTAPRSGLFRFRTKSAESERAAEVEIGLFTGEHLAGLERRFSRLGSELTVEAEDGTVYRLRLGLSGWDSPELLLEWEPADTRPSNDDFAFAQEISGELGEVGGTNEGATLEKSEFWAGLAATVWYEWTAPSDGYWVFHSNVSGREVLAFSGNELSELRFIAEPRPGTPTLFPAREGEVYWIAVASRDASASGSQFELSWWERSRGSFDHYPENDEFSNAEELAGVQGQVEHVGRPALTVEPLEPNETGIATAWWHWTAPESGRYAWRFGNSEVFRLTVFTGGSLESLSLVASGSGGGAVTFEAIQGTTYRLALGRLPDEINKLLHLPNLEWGRTPENNWREDAIQVFGASGSASGGLKYATTERNEPADIWGRESIWWHWDAPSSGWYRFWVEDDPPSTILSLYPSNQVGAASEGAVASSERSLLANGRVETHVLARAGDAFEIRISHRSGFERVDAVNLRWEPAGTPVALRYAGSVSIESLGDSHHRLRDPFNLAIHPDGDHLFATTLSGLLGLKRDPAGGDLSFASSVLDTGVQSEYSYLLWSSEYNQLYSISSISQTFDLDPTQSTLRQSGRVTFNGNLWSRGLRVAAKPGGEILYFLDEKYGPLRVVRIDAEQEMTVIQTITHRAEQEEFDLLVPSLNQPRDIVITPDGSHVFFLAREALSVFSVDADTGELSFVRAVVANSEVADGPFEGLGRLRNLVLDASGRFLFVTGEFRARVALFDISEDASNPEFMDSVTQFYRARRDVDGLSRSLIASLPFNECELAMPHADRVAIDVLCQLGFYSVMWDSDSRDLRISDFANSGTTDRYGELVTGLPGRSRQFVQSPDGKHLYVATGHDADQLPNAIHIFERASAFKVDAGGNHHPSVNQALADQEAIVGQPFSYQFSAATFVDADGDSLSYTAEGMPAWLSFNAQTRRFSGTPGDDDVTFSPVVVTLTAQDGVGTGASTRFGLRVREDESEANLPPARNRALVDQTVHAGQAFTYQFPTDTFADPDGDSLTYSAAGMPAWLSFAPSTRTFSGIPAAGDETRTPVAVTVTAHDGKSGSTSDSFELSVLAATDSSDTAPAFAATDTPANQTYQAGTAIATLTLPEATGGDGTLTYSLTPSVPGLAFDAATRQLTGTPTMAGSHAMTYRVTDADGDRDKLSFTITVNAGDGEGGEVSGLGDCRASMLVRPGQSCTYPGTDDAFSVGADGRGMFLIITSARAININQVTYKGTYYDFRAQHDGDSIWRVTRLEGSTTP